MSEKVRASEGMYLFRQITVPDKLTDEHVAQVRRGDIDEVWVILARKIEPIVRRALAPLTEREDRIEEVWCELIAKIGVPTRGRKSFLESYVGCFHPADDSPALLWDFIVWRVETYAIDYYKRYVSSRIPLDRWKAEVPWHVEESESMRDRFRTAVPEYLSENAGVRPSDLAERREWITGLLKELKIGEQITVRYWLGQPVTLLASEFNVTRSAIYYHIGVKSNDPVFLQKIASMAFGDVFAADTNAGSAEQIQPNKAA